MEWILVAIALLFLMLVATLIVFFLYSGVFDSVQVGAGKPPLGAAVIAYKFVKLSKGSLTTLYASVGKSFTDMAMIAPDNKAVGIFYDDPTEVTSSELHFAVGSVLAEDDKEPDQEMVKQFESEGFKIFKLPQVEYSVNASFPYKSWLTINIAVKKVYPELTSYIAEKKLCAHPFLEIYNGGEDILYMAPLSRQTEFYVPGAVHRRSSLDSTEDKDETQDGEESSSVIDSTLNESSTLGATGDDSTCDDSRLRDSTCDSRLRDSTCDSQLRDSTFDDSGLRDSCDDASLCLLSPGSGDSALEENGTNVDTDVSKEQGSDEDSSSSFDVIKMSDEEAEGEKPAKPE